MINKERLEELIEQGATIYSNEYGEIQLKKENDLSLYENGQNNYILYALEPNKKYHNEIFDEDLFETEAEAKWFAEFGCVERTEKLELPTWEAIQKDKNFHYIRYYHPTKDFSFFMEIYKFANTIRVSWSSGCKKTDPRFDENWQLTKENYLIACRKAKELFLGEKE